MIIYLPLFICLLGLVLFLAAKDPSWSDIKALAKDMFWCGLLAFLLIDVPHMVMVLK